MIGLQHYPAIDGPAHVQARGFTLLELMVTLGVAAILVTVGVPGFISVVQNSRATTHTNELVTALNFARSAATQRGAAVTICRSTTGTACEIGGTDWSTGWVVVSADGELLRTWPARSGGAGIVRGSVDALQFQPRGSVNSAADFDIAVPDCTGNQGREVEINIAGRISVTRVDCS